jgi:hypothetical protein
MANPNPKHGERAPYRQYNQKYKCKFGMLPQPPWYPAPPPGYDQFVDGCHENGEAHV